MTQCNRPAVDIDLGAVEIEIPDEFLGHHREGLVDFKQIDIIERKPRLGEHLARRRDRGVQHQRRRIAHVRHRDDARAWLQAMRPGIIRRRQQDRRRAVDDAG